MAIRSLDHHDQSDTPSDEFGVNRGINNVTDH